MAELSLKHIDKVYDNNVQAVFDFNLDIKDKEFIVFVGPSGCGKSTTLRMIAGLEDITAGELSIDGKVVNDVEPKDRDIAMVFQSYALYPHMSVYDNMAFGLKLRKVSKDEIDKRVRDAAKILEIEEYLDRKPKALSGGQRQRVALGRAIVRNAKVFLMDEPLSNLDAKLRLEMRVVIRNIQREVGITTVYVTHDQEEAMAISDRIAVMKDGVIQHVGTPKNIYHRPANVFVATFIGRTNLIKAELKSGVIHFSNGFTIELDRLKDLPDQSVQVSIRPEEFVLSHEAQGSGFKAVVNDSVYLGLNTQYFIKLETGDEAQIVRESTMEDDYEPGSEMYLGVNKEKINVFTADGERNLLLSE